MAFENIRTSTLRPGILVSLSTEVSGGVHYSRENEEERTEGATLVKTWDAGRVIDDVALYERAQQVRNKCRSLVTTPCAKSRHGYLCTEDNEARLDAAVGEAQAIAAAFNAEARGMMRVDVYVVTGRIAADDAQAVKAISAEVRSLIDRMEQGIRAADVEVIRDAANRLKSVGQMLSPGMQERVKDTIDMVRKQARTIVRAGEVEARVLDEENLRQLQLTRTMFIDLDEAREVAAPVISAQRAIDFEPSPLGGDIAVPAQKATGRQIEL